MIIKDDTFDLQCNKLYFAVLNNIAQLKFEFFETIKFSFSPY